MFNKETYMARRATLKKAVGSGLLLFLGNDECGMNYMDNAYHFRQDSTSISSDYLMSDFPRSSTLTTTRRLSSAMN